MRTHRQRRAPQRGFTLLETLVALLIFSIGLIGVIGLQARSIQFAVDGEDRNRAAVMADEIIANLWNSSTPTSSLDVLSRASFAAGATGGPQGAAATIGVPDADGVVEIRITWRPPSRPATEPASVYATRTFIPPPL